jgi:two-component sensor histidine kinase
LEPGKNFSWISRCQINSNEFIFINYGQNSVVWYNHALKKRVASPLPIQYNEFSWESKIIMLNDTSFALNGGYSGFYIFHINRQTGKITINPKKFLPDHKIRCLYLDSDKRMWVGTSKGLLQQKLAAPFLTSYLFAPLSADSLTGGFSCAYRHKDKLYLGRLSQNKGLVMLNATTMKAEKKFEFYGKNSSWNEIRSIQMYYTDTLWIGTHGGLLWLDTKTKRYGKVFDEKIYSGNDPPKMDILEPARTDGYAWMASHLNGIVARYHITSKTFNFFTANTKPALPFNKVKSIVYDAFGDVWIGGHSLAKWNSRKQIFDTLITVYGGINKYNDDIITMSADNKGSLWLHNVENGLLEYRIREKKFISYTTKDGLPSEVLETFSSVVNKILWIGSPNHLTGFNTETKKCFVYDFQDGFPNETPKGRRIYYDETGAKFYMFCRNYLVQFPITVKSAEHNGSDILVQELMVDNRRFIFHPEGTIRLKPYENNLSLHFSIIDFERNNYQFAYKLNDNQNWIDLNDHRTINLTSLPSGKYYLQLKTKGKSGEEKIKDFSFIIEPPFWKSAGFLIAAGMLLISLGYLAYRYRINQIRQKANIDKLLAQTEMKALHAQMNPHFISNSLNSIREMILTNENKNASHFLTKFAHLIRVTLEQSTMSFITLRSTMDYLQRYVEMEQIRNDAFTCSILADDQLDIDEVILPPMLIQPFVENAIWHGMAGNRKNINVSIYFKKQNNQLICIINDNGIGIEKSLEDKNGATNLNHSVGVSNIKQRISLLNEKYNLRSSVTLEDKSTMPGYNETGTVVTLTLPLEIQEL